jgi:hypothetical protein
MNWCIINAIEKLEAHCLFGRPLPVQPAVCKAEKEIDLIQDGGKI